MWKLLRDRRMEGEKFRRQAVREPYIADFLCERLGLIVELDGAGHEKTVEYDLVRKNELECKGFEVLRFGTEILVSDGGEISLIIRQTIRRLREQKGLRSLADVKQKDRS